MIKVLKFGGTSVGSAENMRKVASIIKNENSRITVLSAMSGTTDALVKIGTLAKSGNLKDIDAEILVLRKKYSDCINDLLSSKQDALAKIEKTFSYIAECATNYKDGKSEKVILAQGELLTSYIFATYLKDSGIKAKLLNAPDFMVTDENLKVRRDLLEKELSVLTKEDGVLYITQGFICTNAEGEIDNLGRGGSDYSAALMGTAISADEVQIWTDIDGMHNNDPRFVDKTFPIRQMSFDEAAELAYFGAKILHPATIQPCKDKGIPVLLKNTMDPNAEGTKITSESEQKNDFTAVAAKDNITVIRIYSTRMLMAYGFLRKVFEVFEVNKTSIDMITTSEVAVSITLDNDTNLDKIVDELKPFGKIEVERNNTIVCVVGKLDHNQAGMGAKVLTSLNSIPVKMISYGASHQSLVLLIDTPNKIEALRSLNKGLFNL